MVKYEKNIGIFALLMGLSFTALAASKDTCALFDKSGKLVKLGSAKLPQKEFMQQVIIKKLFLIVFLITQVTIYAQIISFPIAKIHIWIFLQNQDMNYIILKKQFNVFVMKNLTL